MRALILFICLVTPAFAQDEQTYAMQAIASTVAGPRLCPGLLPNAPVVKGIVTGSNLNIDDGRVEAQVLKYAQTLESRHAAMGHQPFCDMMWSAWGPNGQITPDVLAR